MICFRSDDAIFDETREGHASAGEDAKCYDF